MPQSPSREIRVPFSVGADGGIAWTTDPVLQAIQHILSAVVTNPRERVMRPEYGVPVYSMLFEANDPLVQTDLRSTMDVALKQWVPNVDLVDIKFTGTDPQQGTMQFNIFFRLVGSPNVRTATISVGGTVTETMIPIAQE